jgi:hypothetical protein
MLPFERTATPRGKSKSALVPNPSLNPGMAPPAIVVTLLSESLKSRILELNESTIIILPFESTAIPSGPLKLALVPKENQHDIEVIKRKNPTLIDTNFKIKFVSHINNVINTIF